MYVSLPVEASESRNTRTIGPRTARLDISRKIGQEIAKDKALYQYMLLECGHYTSLYDQHKWPRGTGPRGKLFCELECQKWVKVARRTEPEQLPEDPRELF